MKRIKLKCPYCGAMAVRRTAKDIYGAAAKDPEAKLYVCSRYPACDAYVGVHKRTGLPMGTLANGELRHKRIVAHRTFDRLWQSGLMTKWQAYKWLQAKLDLDAEHTHIAMFSDYMCEQVIALCKCFGKSCGQAA